MNKLLRHIREHSADGLQFGLIVGAGTGTQLGAWRQLGCRRLLLAEAHPRSAEELNHRLCHEQGERLLAVAVTSDEQPTATLYTLNNLAYSSLGKAVDLLTYYPNIRSDETVQVPARSLETVLTEQTLDEQQSHALVIAAPGQALQLLQSTSTPLLQAFTWVMIECSSEPLYQGDSNDSTITGWMGELGFDLVSENPDAIFPHVQLLFKRDPNRVTHHRLVNELLQLRSRLSLSEQTSQRQIEQLEQQLREHEEALRDAKKLVSEQNLRIEKLVSENTSLLATCEELEAKQSELAKANNEQTCLANGLQAEIDSLDHRGSKLAKTCEALTQEKEALAAAHEAKSSLVSDLQAELASLNSRNTELSQVHETLEKKVIELTNQLHVQGQLANERQTKVDVLETAARELAAERDALSQCNAEFTETCDTQTKLANERKIQLDQITAQRNQLQKTVAEQKNELSTSLEHIQTIAALEAELTSLKNTNNELLQTGESLDKNIADLAAALKAQTELANERQASLDALGKKSSELMGERDVLSKANADLTKTCDTYAKHISEQKAQLDTIGVQRDQLQKTVSEQKNALDENQGHMQTLEREAVEYEHRQRLLEEELTKAEAQLELIKDLLLREPGL
ncbi:hypothetical protein [Pseudomonas alabamensis]|uniref:hypothetical protein n=1 Tax=Pseudomonas alabamensis TaxID=3064349 RepID=UPI003F64A988